MSPWGQESVRPASKFSAVMQLSTYSCSTHRITESQNGQGWKGPLGVTQSNPPAEAGSPTVGCRGPCPGGAGISPEKETPQAPLAACSRAPSPSEGRNSSSKQGASRDYQPAAFREHGQALTQARPPHRHPANAPSQERRQGGLRVRG